MVLSVSRISSITTVHGRLSSIHTQRWQYASSIKFHNDKWNDRTPCTFIMWSNLSSRLRTHSLSIHLRSATDSDFVLIDWRIPRIKGHASAAPLFETPSRKNNNLTEIVSSKNDWRILKLPALNQVIVNHIRHPFWLYICWWSEVWMEWFIIRRRRTIRRISVMTTRWFNVESGIRFIIGAYIIESLPSLQLVDSSLVGHRLWEHVNEDGINELNCKWRKSSNPSD